MSDYLRRGLAFVIAIGMVIAVASAPTVAQVADPSVERVFEVAGLNADSVDGQHAVRYSTKKSKRAGKLVATNAAGYLPSNIVKPRWGYVKNKPAGFADNVDNVGVSGVTITRVVSGRVTIASGEYGTVSAYCPEGSVAVGGGFWADQLNAFRLASSKPGIALWSADGMNTSGFDVNIEAHALCIRVLPAAAFATAKKGSSLSSKRSR